MAVISEASPSLPGPAITELDHPRTQGSRNSSSVRGRASWPRRSPPRAWRRCIRAWCYRRSPPQASWSPPSSLT